MVFDVRYNIFKPLKDKVFVTDLERGDRRSKGGVIILDDQMTDRGIHARWGKVKFVPENIDYIEVGEWVLIEHGRWTLGMDFTTDGVTEKTWMIDPLGIIGVSSESGAEHADHAL